MKDPRKRVVEICDFLKKKDLLGPLSSGNVSVKTGNSVFITRKGCPLSNIFAKDVVEVKLDASDKMSVNPSTELPLHIKAYDSCVYDVTEVVHLHSQWVVAASALHIHALPFVHYHQALLGSHMVPYVPFEVPGSGLLASYVGIQYPKYNTRALMLSNHGALVAAEEGKAESLSEVLEDVCRITVLSQASYYHRLRLIDDELMPRIEKMFENYSEQNT